MNRSPFILAFQTVLILMWLLISIPELNAQQYILKKLPTENGLSQNMVQAIIQDYQGFMWFGTKDGLNRYDGHEFIVYKNDHSDSSSLINNNVTFLMEDNKNEIWVGTERGLCVYNRIKDEFRPISFGDRSIADSRNHIKWIVQDRKKSVWVVTLKNELIQFYIDESDSQKYQSKIFSLDIVNNTKFVETPSSLITGPGDTLWIVSQAQLWIARYLENDHVSVTPYTANYKPIIEGARQFIFKDNNSVLWFHTKNAWLLNNKGDSIKPPIRFENNNARYHDLDIDHRYGFEDPEGMFWIGGHKSALTITNSENNRSYSVYSKELLEKYDGDLSKSAFNIRISSMYIDRAGTVWIGTAGYGIYTYSANQEIFNSGNYSKKISTVSCRKILKAHDGNVWFIGADGILYNLEKEGGKPVFSQFKKIVQSDSPNPDYLFRFGQDLYEDEDNTLWMTTEFGLLRIVKSGATIKNIEKYQVLMKNGEIVSFYGICPDKNGNLWIMSEDELFIFNKKRDDFESRRIPLKTQNSEPILSLSLFPGIFAQNDSLFLLMSKTGLKKFNPITYKISSHQFNDIYKSYVVKMISHDTENEHVLWMATESNGLVKYDTKTDKWFNFTQKNGLADNSLYAAIPDSIGGLWISSNNGLMRFDKQNYDVKNYIFSDGLQNNEFNQFAFHSAFDGELFFGGIGGFNRFYPKHLKTNDYNCPVVFTRFKINNEQVNFKKNNATITTLINETKSFTTHYDDKVLTFDFSALDYTNPEKSNYAYWLENFDKEWQYIGNSRTVTFTNLSPGSYQLKIKGSNSFGHWSNKIATLQIHVTPPWYKTWWAYISYILIALFIADRFYRFQLKRQLEKKEAERLIELDSVKTKFFTNISHEFRTPLTVIKGIPELLKNAFHHNKTDRFNKNINILERNSDYLLALVNQLLDLSKLESGTLKLSLTEININREIKLLVHSFESAATQKGIDFQFADTKNDFLVKCDKKALTYIFNNLIGNAIKFTEKGGITIFIENSGKNEVKIVVKDTGIGISNDALPFIFNRFYQVDDSLSKPFEGTGIGLSLVKELTELLGGEITVESTPGEGSSFILTLKNATVINSKAESPLPKKDTLQTHQTALPVDDSKPTLLLVEDNLDMQYFISEILMEDYSVITAINGKLGFEKAKLQIPDFIVSDWMMPELTGPEMIQKLKQHTATSHIPCMLLTAKADQKSILSGYKYGAEAYITKPFDSEEFKLRIKVLIEARNTMRTFLLDQNYLAETSPKYDAEKAFLEKTIKDINAKLVDSALSGEWLASRHFLSRSQFSRKLKAITNKSITQIIQDQRIKKSKELLIRGELNVSEIAYEVGFSDPAYFSRVFSKAEKISPLEFRKNKVG